MHLASRKDTPAFRCKRGIEVLLSTFVYKKCLKDARRPPVAGADVHVPVSKVVIGGMVAVSELLYGADGLLLPGAGKR